MQIILFGQLTDITGNNQVLLTGITDTNGLVEELNKRYPAMIAAKYVIAVDRKVVSGNIMLKDDSTVALMPPFSGG